MISSIIAYSSNIIITQCSKKVFIVWDLQKPRKYQTTLISKLNSIHIKNMLPQELEEQLKFIEAFADTISNTFKQFAQICRVHVKKAQNGRPEYTEMQNQLIQERKKRMQLEEKIRQILKGTSVNEDLNLPPPEEKKRPKNAFTLYVADQKERILKDNPTMNFDKIVTLLALKWRRLQEQQRAMYEKKFIAISKLYNQPQNNPKEKNIQEKQTLVKKEDNSFNEQNEQQKNQKNNNDEDHGQQKEGFAQNEEENMGTMLVENQQQNQATLQMQVQEPRPLERMLDLFHTPVQSQHSAPNEELQEDQENQRHQTPQPTPERKQDNIDEQKMEEGKEHLQKTEPVNIAPSIEIINPVLIEPTVQEDKEETPK